MKSRCSKKKNKPAIVGLTVREAFDRYRKTLDVYTAAKRELLDSWERDGEGSKLWAKTEAAKRELRKAEENHKEGQYLST